MNNSLRREAWRKRWCPGKGEAKQTHHCSEEHPRLPNPREVCPKKRGGTVKGGFRGGDGWTMQKEQGDNSYGGSISAKKGVRRENCQPTLGWGGTKILGTETLCLQGTNRF